MIPPASKKTPTSSSEASRIQRKPNLCDPSFLMTVAWISMVFQVLGLVRNTENLQQMLPGTIPNTCKESQSPKTDFCKNMCPKPSPGTPKILRKSTLDPLGTLRGHPKATQSSPRHPRYLNSSPQGHPKLPNGCHSLLYRINESINQ